MGEQGAETGRLWLAHELGGEQVVWPLLDPASNVLPPVPDPRKLLIPEKLSGPPVRPPTVPAGTETDTPDVALLRSNVLPEPAPLNV